MMVSLGRMHLMFLLTAVPLETSNSDLLSLSTWDRSRSSDIDLIGLEDKLLLACTTLSLSIM